ncbi:MAG: type II toxin-antitoxin system RelB/DinJ family antitoxin [Desulfosporosinus sp.]
MAKEATLQVRMDAVLKDEVEQLYRSLGTSFAEAVRIFAKQSIEENGMPFVPRANRGEAFGIAAKYANPSLMAQEEGAFERAVTEKYGNN